MTGPVAPLSRLLSRPRLAGLVVVLVLLGGALVVGLRGDGGSPAAASPLEAPGLAAARTAAALPACPRGLTTDLPDLRLGCYGGGPYVTASAAPGRPTLVNLWATWCAPCVREVPLLGQLEAAAGDRLDVVGVVVSDSPASVYAFAQAFGVHYPLVDDPLGKVLPHFGTGLPKTLLVSADGRVVHVQQKPYTSFAELTGSVAENLGVQVAG